MPDERLSDERLSEIEKRCAAATPGPWVQADLWLPWLQWLWSQARKAWGYTADPDFFFIAHARADVPALLAEVRRLRAVERELRGHVRALVGRVESLTGRAEGGATMADSTDPRDAGLLALRESGVRGGEVWRHRGAGGRYAVVHLCLVERGCVPAVTYLGLADGTLWVRPLAEFLERFVREG